MSDVDNKRMCHGCMLSETAKEHRKAIAELQAENATLRSCLSDDAENSKLLLGENRQLRELVRDMWSEGAFEAGACYVEAAGRLEERTRELGIEVDA